ncbi:hypothetical protein [Chitinophaga sp.]|uniref:hypothetical protein n=1 Tax=Chitinophaga sp. TaxID=1869181 RepID=UPI0031D16EB6
MNKPAEALEAYEINLKDRPNRFNALYNAGLAAERSGNAEKARSYYAQLLKTSNATGASRPELAAARLFLEKNKVLAVKM